MAAKKLPEAPGKKPKAPGKPRKVADPIEIPTNFSELQKTISELRKAGRLGPEDAARIQIALGLAAAVDSMPDNPTIWREYRAAEKALREEGSTHGDPFDQLLASISAEIRDEAKQEEQKPRSRSRRDS